MKYFAGPIFHEGDTLTLLAGFIFLYILLFGPFVMLTAGVVLIWRAKYLKRSARTGWIVLAIGAVLSVLTLIFKSLGSI